MYYTYENGHAWVIDGYEDKKRKTTYTYRWEWVGDGDGGIYPLATAKKSTSTEEVYDGMIETYSSTYSTRYLIMNWGWNGSYDTGRYISNSGWEASIYNFRYEKEIICDFNF